MTTTTPARQSTNLLLAVLTAALALTVAGCAGTAPSTSPAPSRAETSRVTVSRNQVFTSLRELTRSSQAVVIAEALEGTTEDVAADVAGESPFRATAVKVRVLQSLRGTARGTLTVRLITSTNDSSEVPPPLAEGGRYVLFLTPFSWSPDVPADGWTVPGGAGIYRVSGSGLALVSRGPDALPKSLSSVAALRDAVPGLLGALHLGTSDLVVLD